MLQEPVICFSNEWTNPIIGFGNYIDYITLSKNPVLVINDILTDREFMAMGVVKLITPETLDLILDLNPYQGWNLFSSGLANVSYNKPKITNALLSKEEILKIVEDNELWD